MPEVIKQVFLQSPVSAGSVRLFCFPQAGGDSSAFSNWSQYLPACITVKGVDLPGHQRRFREPPFERMAPLVQSLVRELRPSLTSPLALFGHSLGALIAFEFAREMLRNGLPKPSHLFVSSFPAPQLPQRNLNLQKLPPQLFRQRVWSLLPHHVASNEELLDIVLPALRADFVLVETYEYTPEAALDCPITAMGGAWDLNIQNVELRQWAQQTTSDFNLQLFPGKHDYLQDKPEPVLEFIGTTLQHSSLCNS